MSNHSTALEGSLKHCGIPQIRAFLGMNIVYFIEILLRTINIDRVIVQDKQNSQETFRISGHETKREGNSNKFTEYS